MSEAIAGNEAIITAVIEDRESPADTSACSCADRAEQAESAKDTESVSVPTSTFQQFGSFA